jgi:D-amino-acid dehydrogenase
MRILVLGAGVVGTCSAWYLSEAGHRVTVIDRQPAAGCETSFANGGQISVCHAEPWANPHVFGQVWKWLGREDAPLLFRLRFDPALFAWGLRFLRECLPGRTRRNIGDIVALALYSRSHLQALRQEVELDYDALTRGILHVYTDAKEFVGAQEAARLMQELGLDRLQVDADRCVEIEPALAPARAMLVGGDYTASDESGDAHRFTQALATHCREAGVEFRHDCSIDKLVLAGGQVAGVVVDDGSSKALLNADAYVLCLGSYSPLLLKPLGIYMPVYPAKGYSVTLPLADSDCAAPFVSITDDEHKIVFSRLGQRLRVAGTAEFNGYNLELNAVRCQALIDRTHQWFPDLQLAGEAEPWCGLRPATPSNLPLIGRSPIRNLWFNTGHGTLGWTMACGSGAALADLMSGRQPDVAFPFLGN